MKINYVPHLNHCALIGVHSCIFRARCRISMRARVLIPEGVARDEDDESPDPDPDPDTAVRPTLYGLPCPAVFQHGQGRVPR